MDKNITYKGAGVNIDKAEESLSLIKPHIKSTLNISVLASIGSFGALYDLGAIIKEYKNPVIVQSIDSVGTKLAIANMAGKHSTIGMDMVAHSCNDILCQGARPITFLDYIAVDRLEPEHINEVIEGITTACREVHLPLIGGETAELPGIYKTDEYDLVGSITGVVERDKIITGKNIKHGDVIIGLESNGLHTNGYSLVRKALFDIKRYKIDSFVKEINATLAEELLKPHKNYTTAVLPLLDKCEIKGIAHITGGGLQGNICRILPPECIASIKNDSWEYPPIFKFIQKQGNIPDNDMQRTFNLGIGLVLIVKEEDSCQVAAHLKHYNIKSFIIGQIVRHSQPKNLLKIFK